MLCRASVQPSPDSKVPKKKPGRHAGLSLRSYISPVFVARNLATNQSGSTWQDSGGEVALVQFKPGVAQGTQGE
jgi:hypothetical protein